MANLDLIWNHDKILSDSLTSAKVYYREPFLTPPIFIGTVSEVAPKISISHEWGQAGGGVMDVLSNITSYVSNLFKSLEGSVGQVAAASTGSYNFTRASSVVTQNFNSMFKQYEGSSFEITLPEVTITLLPTDRPELDGIGESDTPAKKLLNIINYQVAKDSTNVSDDNGVTGKLIKSIMDAAKEAGLEGFITKEFSKLRNTNLIGSSAYYGSQLFSIAPCNFVRSYDYKYPTYLQGTMSLVVNGIIYRNLLLKSVDIECSKTRIINNNADYGPSCIKLHLTFEPAIKYTVRDIEDIVVQLVNSPGYSLHGSSYN